MTSRLLARICVGGALCALSFAALTLPAAAGASHGHARKAHRAKAKKKSKGPSVKVKCASVGVTCKGKPGPAGPQGPAGANGAAGAPGLNGAKVVLRARGSGMVVATFLPEECELFIRCSGGQVVPVSPASWTEGATEDDQLVGSATLSTPSKAECAAENIKKEATNALGEVGVLVNGVLEGLIFTETSTSAVTTSGPIAFDLGFVALEEGSSEGSIGSGFLIGSGALQPQAITVKVADNCTGAVHASVSNVVIDVLGFS